MPRYALLSSRKLTRTDGRCWQLWMGTHDTLPTYLSSESAEQGDKLASTLAADPERYVSKKVIEKFPDAKGGHLPFLLKVLSIGKALSIQAHPDKELAKRLNSERGDVYKGKSEVNRPVRGARSDHMERRSVQWEVASASSAVRLDHYGDMARLVTSLQVIWKASCRLSVIRIRIWIITNPFRFDHNTNLAIVRLSQTRITRYVPDFVSYTNNC